MVNNVEDDVLEFEDFAYTTEPVYDDEEDDYYELEAPLEDQTGLKPSSPDLRPPPHEPVRQSDKIDLEVPSVAQTGIEPESIDLELPPVVQPGIEPELPDFQPPTREPVSQMEDIDLEVPSFVQPGIKTKSNVGLTVPRQRPNVDRPVPRLNLPTVQRDRLSSFNRNVLRPPSNRQNPLLKLLRFDSRERTFRKGLSPPDFNKSPVFRQIMRTPQR